MAAPAAAAASSSSATPPLDIHSLQSSSAQVQAGGRYAPLWKDGRLAEVWLSFGDYSHYKYGNFTLRIRLANEKHWLIIEQDQDRWFNTVETRDTGDYLVPSAYISTDQLVLVNAWHIEHQYDPQSISRTTFFNRDIYNHIDVFEKAWLTLGDIIQLLEWMEKDHTNVYGSHNCQPGTPLNRQQVVILKEEMAERLEQCRPVPLCVHHLKVQKDKRKAIEFFMPTTLVDRTKFSWADRPKDYDVKLEPTHSQLYFTFTRHNGDGPLVTVITQETRPNARAQGEFWCLFEHGRNLPSDHGQPTRDAKWRQSSITTAEVLDFIHAALEFRKDDPILLEWEKRVALVLDQLRRAAVVATQQQTDEHLIPDLGNMVADWLLPSMPKRKQEASKKQKTTTDMRLAL
jgi:hypothetical protein